LLVALAQGQRLGGLHETAGAVRVFLDIHSLLPRPVRPPRRHGRTSSLGSRHAQSATAPSYGPSRAVKGLRGFSWRLARRGIVKKARRWPRKSTRSIAIR
jgi:hypothetical protein